jgi:hypothetical protein
MILSPLNFRFTLLRERSADPMRSVRLPDPAANDAK